MATKYWIGTTGDVSLTSNWSGGSLPVANDVVILPAGSGSMTSNLGTLAAVSLYGFQVQTGYTGTIGSISTGAGYLQILIASTYTFQFAGTGIAYIDLQSSPIAPLVTNTQSQGAGTVCLYLKGSALTTLTVQRGSVGLAAFAGETSTVATVNCDWISNQTSDSYVYLGSGVTVTTVNATGGAVVVNSAATTILTTGGIVTTQGTGAVTTITNAGGTVYPNSSGTITTLNANGGTCDFSRSLVARTVTNMATTGNGSSGATINYDPNVVTVTNKLSPSGPVSITIRGK